MKVNVLSYVAGKSSKRLVEALVFNGVDAKFYDLKKDGEDRKADYVFGYGCSAKSYYNDVKRLNNPQAVKKCVDKVETFKALQAAGVDTVEFCTRLEDVPAHWSWVTIREKVDGRKAEGLEYAENIKGKIPNGSLFSEYFEHKYEYRIVVFRGVVVGRYYKKEDAGDWYFNNQPSKGFEKMDDHCLRAAKALGIDYVGFDVVAVNKKNFKILEANSGALLTDEAENAIVEYFINL